MEGFSFFVRPSTAGVPCHLIKHASLTVRPRLIEFSASNTARLSATPATAEAWF